MIRDATLADIPTLIDMGWRFADACDLHSIAPYDPESMANTFRHLIEDDNGILLICDGGAAGGMVHPAYWNASHITGQEVFWWMDPDSRGLGLDLLDRLEDAARDKGARSWGMITLEAIRPEATGRLYQRRGYSPSEHSYIKVF